MVRTSDMVVYGMFAMVLIGVVYITTIHMFAHSQQAAASSHDHQVLAEYGKPVNDIIDNNIAHILHSRPTIATEVPIAENMNFKPLYNVLDAWNPDNPDEPSDFAETLQHFDFGNPAERAMAEKFRNAELPFKLFNMTEFTEVANLWTDKYLHDQLMTNITSGHLDKSKDNQ